MLTFVYERILTRRGSRSFAACAPVAVAALIAASAISNAAEWTARTVDPGSRVFEVAAAPDGTVHVESVAGDWRVLDLPEALAGEQSRGPGRPRLEPRMIPHAQVATGENNIRRAWLARPTARYRHGVLGDTIEAAELHAKLADGRPVNTRVGPGSVFEDLTPRIADLDGDGADEIVVVRSYLDRGAALAVYRAGNGRISHVAETAPVGQPNRWLNPAGIADYDGDGKPEIAIVVTPHIGGILQLWRLEGETLVKVAEARTYSNHAIGSPILTLSVTGDFDGDGTADLALPSADRAAIRFVSFAGGVTEIASVALESKALGGMALAGTTVLVALEDGRLAVIETAE